MSQRRYRQTAAEENRIPATRPMHTQMGLKRIVTIVLLLFIATSLVYLILSDSPVHMENPGENSRSAALVVTAPTSEATGPVVAAQSSGSPDKAGEAPRRVIVHYFHGTARCSTCRKIEQYTSEALVTAFPGELESGTLEWRPINVEEPQNQHFIEDYELSMRSVVLADMGGVIQIRWKNLDRIWALVGNKSAFISYVQDETRAYLERN